MPAGGCDSPRTPGPEGFPGLQYERSTTDRQPDSRPGRPAPSRPQAGIYQRRDASRPHESEGDLQRPAGEKHRRGLGDVRQGVVAAGKWHGVKVQRTVAQPNHQRANSRRDRRSGRQPNRQPSNHLRSAVLSPLPHQCRCHDSQHTQEPQQHKWRDEEVLGFAAQILVHPLTRACDGHDGMDWRGDPRPQATDQHTGRRQTQHHKQDRPCPRRPRCTGRLGRSAKTGWLGHRCVAKSAESTCPWREQRAHQPSGRTWTTIRRPHCAQNRGGSRPIRAAVGVAVSASSPVYTLYTPAATGARCFPATISTIYRLALSAFSGICSSSSSSRSASAGRPRVVR